MSLASSVSETSNEQDYGDVRFLKTLSKIEEISSSDASQMMKLTAFNGTSLKFKVMNSGVSRTESNLNNTSYLISANSELNRSFDRGCSGLVRMNLLADQAKF